MTISPRVLSVPEFQATFVHPMVNVTCNAEEVVDLWAYAEHALRHEFPDVCSCDWTVKHIYEASNGAFQHAMIPTHLSNLYLVVVIDKLHGQVFGHLLLDLGTKYGVVR